MRKKYSNILLIVVILCFAVLAIASIEEDTPVAPTESITTPQAVTDADSTDVQESDVSDENNNETPSPTEDDTPRVEVPDGGLILFDDDNMVVTVTGIQRNRSGFVTEIEFLIENNGAVERSIETLNRNFITTAVSINNFSIATSLSADVAPGRAARDRMRIDRSDAELFELRNVYKITAEFETYTRDGLARTDKLSHEPSTVIIQENDLPEFTNGNFVFANEDFEVFSAGFSSGFLSYSAIFVIRNTTGNDYNFSLDGINVNGIMNESTRGSNGNIFNNTYRVFSIRLDDDVNANDVREIEFRVEVGDFNTVVAFNTEYLATVVIEY